MGLKITYRHSFAIENDAEAKRLFIETPDAIMYYLYQKMIEFKKICFLDDIDDIDNIIDNCRYIPTADAQFLVKYTRGNEKKLWRIDIFRKSIVIDNTEKTSEYCPYCEQDVEIENELKVQICPNCGRAIVPCNICTLCANGNCSNNCPLEKLSQILNE